MSLLDRRRNRKGGHDGRRTDSGIVRGFFGYVLALATAEGLGDKPSTQADSNNDTHHNTDNGANRETLVVRTLITVLGGQGVLLHLFLLRLLRLLRLRRLLCLLRLLFLHHHRGAIRRPSSQPH